MNPQNTDPRSTELHNPIAGTADAVAPEASISDLQGSDNLDSVLRDISQNVQNPNKLSDRSELKTGSRAPSVASKSAAPGAKPGKATKKAPKPGSSKPPTHLAPILMATTVCVLLIAIAVLAFTKKT